MTIISLADWRLLASADDEVMRRMQPANAGEGLREIFEDAFGDPFPLAGEQLQLPLEYGLHGPCGRSDDVRQADQERQ